MPPRSWKLHAATWALAAVILSVALLLLLRGSESEQTGESAVQFTHAPGAGIRGDMLWGEPNRDLYPSIDHPEYASAAEADSFLEPDDRVFVFEREEGLFVFPEVLLASYHVVNDVIGGEPVAITFCLLAGSANVFSRRAGDRVLTLGLTGQLYCGNSVLYDRETETDWLQINGEPIQGPLFGKERLAARPLERSSWRQVRERESVRVLAPRRPMKFYRQFFEEMEAEQFGLKVIQSAKALDPRLLPYTAGVGLRVQGDARFYPGPYEKRDVIHDTVGGWSVLVVPDSAGDSYRVFRRRYKGEIYDFDLAGGRLVDRQTGSRWNERGICVEGALAGARLDKPVYTQVYWFVWSTLHPETEIRS